MTNKIKIFVSYGVTNSNLFIPELIKIEFDKILRECQEYNIEITFDRDFIKAGGNWDDSIKNELESSNVIFFLINDKFLSSEYILNVEFKSSIHRNDIKILHAKLFQCDDYKELAHIQSLNLNNLPFFPFKEEQYEDTPQNRFEIQKIADRLYRAIKTHFNRPTKSIIHCNVSPEQLKVKINRRNELSEFETIVNKANPKSCNIFLYKASKLDLPHYFNFRTDEIVNNNRPYLSYSHSNYINMFLFNKADNDLDFITNFICEIRRIFTPNYEIDLIFNDTFEAIQYLYKFLRNKQITKIIVPFKISSLEANNEGFLNDFMKLISFFDFKKINDSGVFMYFLINTDTENIEKSKLFLNLKDMGYLSKYTILDNIKDEDLDDWVELATGNVISQSVLKNKITDYLKTDYNKSLPTKLGYMQEPIDKALKDFFS